jgi:hypothetical protein
VELGGLEPPTSWVRSRRTFAPIRLVCRVYVPARRSDRRRRFRPISDYFSPDRAKAAVFGPVLPPAKLLRDEERRRARVARASDVASLRARTPRTTVRVSLSNRAKTPAHKRDARVLHRAGKNRKLRSVLGDSGDRWRPVARWCASAAGGPHSAPGRAPAVRSSRAPTASLAPPRAHLEQWPIGTSARSHRHAPATAAPSVVSTAASTDADRAAADAPSRRSKET